MVHLSTGETYLFLTCFVKDYWGNHKKNKLLKFSLLLVGVTLDWCLWASFFTFIEGAWILFNDSVNLSWCHKGSFTANSIYIDHFCLKRILAIESLSRCGLNRRVPGTRCELHSGNVKSEVFLPILALWAECTSWSPCGWVGPFDEFWPMSHVQWRVLLPGQSI